MGSIRGASGRTASEKLASPCQRRTGCESDEIGVWKLWSRPRAAHVADAGQCGRSLSSPRVHPDIGPDAADAADIVSTHGTRPWHLRFSHRLGGFGVAFVPFGIVRNH